MNNRTTSLHNKISETHWIKIPQEELEEQELMELKHIYRYVFNSTIKLLEIQLRRRKIKKSKLSTILDRYIPYFNKDIDIDNKLDNITANLMRKSKNISPESVVIYENYIYSPVLTILV